MSFGMLQIHNRSEIFIAIVSLIHFRGTKEAQAELYR